MTEQQLYMCHKRKLIDRLRGIRKAGGREFGREVPLPPSSRLSRFSRAQNPLSISNACRAGELIEDNFNTELLCSVC